MTNQEKLEMKVRRYQGAAVITYGYFTIATYYLSNKGFKVEIYELIDNDMDRYEARISLIETAEGFEDNGHALEWAFGKISK